MTTTSGKRVTDRERLWREVTLYLAFVGIARETDAERIAREVEVARIARIREVFGPKVTS